MLGLRSRIDPRTIVSEAGRLIRRLGRPGIPVLSKAEQLGLFGRKPVQNPGSRGGSYHLDEKGHVRYGAQRVACPKCFGQADICPSCEGRGSVSREGFHEHARSAVEGRLGEHAPHAPFTLQPPELGQTRSGKAIPHVDDPRAANPETGQYDPRRGPHFHNFTAADHTDARRVHAIYGQHHARSSGNAAIVSRSAANEHHRLGNAHARAETLHEIAASPDDWWKKNRARQPGPGKRPMLRVGAAAKE